MIEMGDAQGLPKAVVDRAFAIMDCFRADRRYLTLRDMEEATGLAKATVHRLAITLVRLGALEREGNDFRLGLRLFEMGGITYHSDLRERSLRILEGLRRECNETVQLGLLDREEVLYLLKLVDSGGVIADSRVGGRLPASSTAIGKAMLAYTDPESLTMDVTESLATELQSIRTKGVAIDRGDTVSGVLCVGSPIFQHKNVIAGISIMVPVRTAPLHSIVPAVQRTAVRLSHHLSAHPAFDR